jgi:very-short-patch-repair endonuclease
MYEGINVDFYIPEINTVIEVQGVQHYQPSSFGRDSVDTVIQYTKQLNRDDRLRTVCKSRGINVVEIPYDYAYTQILTELTGCKDEYNRD